MNLDLLAKDLKLCAIGVADAKELREDYDRFLGWLNKGYHGNMSWLAKSAKKRSDPSHLLPEPKSVIVCAIKYDSIPWRNSKSQAPNPKQIPNKETYALPKYLQHKDYHEVMMEKLELVVLEVKKEYPDLKYKCYVDTGPILEKSWAAHAGIGFIGKNTLVINPEFGSQIALGVIVCSIECHPESKGRGIPRTQLSSGDSSLSAQNDRGGCDNCTACIDACPTKALVAPYTLDARKCISYKFFIDKKEGGCDTCQDVCPYNKEKI